MNGHAEKRIITLDFKYPQSPVEYLTYQNYFLMGMNADPSVTMKYRPVIGSLMVKLIQHKIKGATRLWSVIGKGAGQRLRPSNVGCYILESGSQSIKFSIDSSDTRWVQDDDALQWSDVYFKTNKWRDLRYPEKIRSLMNGNGTLTDSKIQHLKLLRNEEKSTDLVYWTKIWEPNHFEEGKVQNIRNLIEHQVKLFETLSELRCTKSLLAILPEHFKTVSLSECKNRLDSAGVKWQHGWGNIYSADLWKGLSSAKIVFLRPGNHLCISWRMTDLLCMGACVVYDGVPVPQWHKPINEGEHYVDGGCGISNDYSLLPSTDQYISLNEKIKKILSDDHEADRFRQNAAGYFDEYGEPRAVAQHILDVVENVGL